MDLGAGVAILLDGEFVKKVLQKSLGKFPAVADINAVCEHIKNYPDFADRHLHRTFYYTANPLMRGSMKNPLDGTTINFAATQQSQENMKLLDALDLQPNFAVRRGTLAVHGWKLKTKALRNIERRRITSITSADLAPNIQQKGVDMRIGLDLAALALKRLVSAVVLVTGDADMVPAMKFARREGLRVYLHTMGHAGVHKELKVHADILIP